MRPKRCIITVMAMIQITNLTKRYRDLVAVRDLNLTIKKGDVFGFIGPNGAGKTTTIKTLATLLEPTTGAAYVDGIDVVRNPLEVRRLIGYMPDFFGVYDDVKVWEYLDFFAAAYKIPTNKRKGIIDDVLDLTDLTGKREDYVESLSRGMKQRLCLAKTLVHDPKVLLLDEPASGLDPRARIEFRALLKELQSMGKTIFVSSHILPELADFCNVVGIMERGHLVVSGPINDIVQKLEGHIVVDVRLTGEPDNGARFAAIDGLSADQRSPHRGESRHHRFHRHPRRFAAVARPSREKPDSHRVLRPARGGFGRCVHESHQRHGAVARRPRMRRFQFLFLLIVLAAPLLNSMAGDAQDDGVLLPDAPAGDIPSGDISRVDAPSSEGEIRLVGTVRSVHVARGSFILEAIAFSLASGRSQVLATPRPKLILISPQTLLNGEAPARPLAEHLKSGDYIAVVGNDLGNGKELPARNVTILSSISGITPATGSTPGGSTAGSGAGSASSTIPNAGVTTSVAATPPVAPQADEQQELMTAARQRWQALQLAQSKVRFDYFSGGAARAKLVALTFDDGPDTRCTPQILDILKREKVPATFFVIGRKVEKYPQLVLRAVTEGHDVGNHTYHHFQVGNLDAQNWRFEIEQTNQVLTQILGGPTRWFRAPGCHYTLESLATLRALKLVRVDTTANSGDSNGTSPSAIVSRSLKNLAPGAVILCHDRIPNTVAALPQLIRAIRQRGYRIVSLSELALRAQATPGFVPQFWPANQGITIEGQLPQDAGAMDLMAGRDGY